MRYDTELKQYLKSTGLRARDLVKIRAKNKAAAKAAARRPPAPPQQQQQSRPLATTSLDAQQLSNPQLGQPFMDFPSLAWVRPFQWELACRWVCCQDFHRCGLPPVSSIRVSRCWRRCSLRNNRHKACTTTGRAVGFCRCVFGRAVDARRRWPCTFNVFVSLQYC